MFPPNPDSLVIMIGLIGIIDWEQLIIVIKEKVRNNIIFLLKELKESVLLF